MASIRDLKKDINFVLGLNKVRQELEKKATSLVEQLNKLG